MTSASTHTPTLHLPLRQSRLRMHRNPVLHAPQKPPPQSTSVSLPSCVPLPQPWHWLPTQVLPTGQLASMTHCTHIPDPLHTSALGWVHAAPQPPQLFELVLRFVSQPFVS